MTTTPEEREAPDGLELIRLLVNTRDIETDTDALATPAALEAWLAEAGLLVEGVRPTVAEHGWVVGVREALRELLVANADGEPPAREAVDALNAAAEACRLAPRLGADGSSAIASDGAGVERAVGALLAIMHDEIAHGRWPRLKACVEPTCHWAFYDTSRNHSSHWCNMGVCGNRNKNRAYYARQRDQRG